MTYAEIKSNNIAKIGPRPNWRDDNGDPVSDELLAAQGWLPIIYSPPAYNPASHTVAPLPQSYWVIDATQVLVTYNITPIPFEQQQNEALARINSEYSARTAMLAEGYPEDEQKSWPVQIQEADIVLGADDQPTPWIDNAAPARGVTRAALAALIQAQDTAYRQYHGGLTGVRQALRDAVLAVPDDPNAADAFAAIQWPTE